MTDSPQISILLGGISSEREVSMESGLAVFAALEKSHKVRLVYLNEDLKEILDELALSDTVFNALHGGAGENGDIQSVFDLLKIKYTGSGPMACKLAMSKHQTKLIAVDNNIPTPDWILLKFTDNKKVQKIHIPENKLQFPLVVKPDNEGSTIGLTVVENQSMVDQSILLAGEFSDEIVVEDYIPGREITVAVLGDKALPIVEIFPESSVYDYKSKYTAGKSEYVCPADISTKLTKKIQDDAVKIHKLLGCRHYSRVDFRLDENGNHFLLELNTLPGMTSTSLVPKAAKAAGLSFEELIQTILQTAMENK